MYNSLIRSYKDEGSTPSISTKLTLKQLTIMEDFVTYEQAVKLKKLGFEWEVKHFYVLNNANEPKLCRLPDTLGGQDNHNNYHGSFSAPTLAQAQKWLRKVKDIIIGIDFDNWHDKYVCHLYKRMGYSGKNFRDTYGSRLVTNEFHEDFNTYEQALSAGIDKALELLKEENNGNQD